MADSRKTFLTPVNGIIVGSAGTDLIDLVLDAKTATTNPTQPAASVLAGSIEESVPDGANYLELYELYTGTEPSTDPIVRVYGKTSPYGQNALWFPCQDINPASPAFTATLDALLVEDSAQLLRGFARFYIAGARRVVVTLPTASAGSTTSKIVGRFVV